MQDNTPNPTRHTVRATITEAYERPDTRIPTLELLLKLDEPLTLTPEFKVESISCTVREGVWSTKRIQLRKSLGLPYIHTIPSIKEGIPLYYLSVPFTKREIRDMAGKTITIHIDIFHTSMGPQIEVAEITVNK